MPDENKNTICNLLIDEMIKSGSETFIFVKRPPINPPKKINNPLYNILFDVNWIIFLPSICSYNLLSIARARPLNIREANDAIKIENGNLILIGIK